MIANSLGVANSVTIVAAVNHTGVNLVDPGGWINFNYVFIPKEVTVLNNTLGQPNNLNDTGYQPDVTVVPLPSPAPGSPFLNMSNANGEFSPKLIFADPVVPEPASVAIAALALWRWAPPCGGRLANAAVAKLLSDSIQPVTRRTRVVRRVVVVSRMNETCAAKQRDPVCQLLFEDP